MKKLLLGVLVLYFAFTCLITIWAYSWVGHNISYLIINNISMQPNLNIGDRIVVGKINMDNIKRGDLVLFSNMDSEYIKRVIGLPGETVEIIDGFIYIDGNLLLEDYSTIPGKYDVEAQEMANDEFFLLGDNRPSSSDSHSIGPIKGSQITGKVLEQYLLSF